MLRQGSRKGAIGAMGEIRDYGREPRSDAVRVDEYPVRVFAVNFRNGTVDERINGTLQAKGNGWNANENNIVIVFFAYKGGAGHR